MRIVPLVLAAALLAAPLAGCPGHAVVTTAGLAGHGTSALLLRGTVLAPPGVISNNGATMVGRTKLRPDDGGASMVGRTKYALATAPGQVPVPNVTVELRDAAGQPVTGFDGAPVRAQTDATGRYQLAAPRAGRAYVVVALLDGGAALQAMAPKSSDDALEHDVDLYSSLVATYVLERYVRAQTDPQAALDRLTDDLAGGARAAAAAAVAAGGAAPGSASAADLIQAVEALRRRDHAFDQRLEDLRRALVVAGASDLGNGRPATEVPLTDVAAVVPAADGGLYLACPEESRVWRLRPDGRLETVAGTGSYNGDDFVPGPAVETSLALPRHLAPAAQGALWILEDLSVPQPDQPTPGRLSRLDADGRLTTWTASLKNALAVVPGSGPDEALVLATDENGARLLACTRDAEPRLVRDMKGTPLSGARALARDAGGRLYLDVPGSGAATVYRLADPTASQPEVVWQGALPHVLDEAGGLVLLDPDQRQASVRPADGPARTIATSLPDGYGDGIDAGFAAGGYVVQANQVFQAKDGQLQIVAGQADRAALPANAAALSVDDSSGLGAVGGDVYLAQGDRHRILKLAPGQAPVVFAGTGDAGNDGDGGPATAAHLTNPGPVRADAHGALYFVQDGRTVRKIDPTGLITTLPATGGLDAIADLAVTPDGTLFLAGLRTAGGPMTVLRVAPDGASTSVEQDPTPGGNVGFAVGPDGTLYLAGVQQGVARLARWTTAHGLETIKQDRHFSLRDSDGKPTSGMAVDARGRVYVADSDRDVVWRYDPSTDGFADLTGANGIIFNGIGADRSTLGPRFPAFTVAGDLYFVDDGHGQIKRIPAAVLAN